MITKIKLFKPIKYKGNLYAVGDIVDAEETHKDELLKFGNEVVTKSVRPTKK